MQPIDDDALNASPAERNGQRLSGADDRRTDGKPTNESKDVGGFAVR